MESLWKEHMVASHAIAAAASVTFGVALTHPLDSLKTLIQVGASSNQQLTTTQVLGRVVSISGSGAYFLNPKYHYSRNLFEDNSLKRAVHEVYDHLFPDCPGKDTFGSEIVKFRDAVGMFGCHPAVKSRNAMMPCFYSGFGWSALGRISGLGARFGIYELLTAFYKDGREENYVYVSEALLAGIAGGAVEAVLSTPFELFKLRAQVSSAFRSPTSNTVEMKHCIAPTFSKLLRGYTPDKKAWDLTVGLLAALPTKNSNMVGALKEYPWMMTGTGRPPLAYEVQGPLNVISLEGWRALWTGLRSGIFRDSIFGGIFFSCWQFLHIAMLDWKAVGMDPPPSSMEEIGPVSPLAASLAAGFSGSVAAAASHCFDTAKCRTQCIVTPKYMSMEKKLLRWKEPGYWLERVSGISPLDRSILFRGIWLRMARSGLASFAIVGSYFLAVDHLT